MQKPTEDFTDDLMEDSLDLSADNFLNSSEEVFVNGSSEESKIDSTGELITVEPTQARADEPTYTGN